MPVAQAAGVVEVIVGDVVSVALETVTETLAAGPVLFAASLAWALSVWVPLVVVVVLQVML